MVVAAIYKSFKKFWARQDVDSKGNLDSQETNRFFQDTLIDLACITDFKKDFIDLSYLKSDGNNI